jgi:hypothetical protein
MQNNKFSFWNLFIGAVLGLILTPFIGIAVNLIAAKFNQSIDIEIIGIIVIPISMVGMLYVLRERKATKTEKGV